MGKVSVSDAIPSLGEDATHDGLSSRELVQLMLQTLGDMGLKDSAAALERETGVALLSVFLRKLQKVVFGTTGASEEIDGSGGDVPGGVGDRGESGASTAGKMSPGAKLARWRATRMDLRRAMALLQEEYGDVFAVSVAGFRLMKSDADDQAPDSVVTNRNDGLQQDRGSTSHNKDHLQNKLHSSRQHHGESSARALRAICFLLCEHAYLEALCLGDIWAAIDLLQSTLADLAGSGFQQRVHSLAGLALCRNGAELEKMARFTWDAGKKTLWERLVSLLPSSVVLPPKRLTKLLYQAFRFQELTCLYHDPTRAGLIRARSEKNANGSVGKHDPLLPNPYSLLDDYQCPAPELPKTLARVVEDHGNEVWCVSVSHAGRWIATAGRDGYIFVYDTWERFRLAHTFRVSEKISGGAQDLLPIGGRPGRAGRPTAGSQEAKAMHVDGGTNGQQDFCTSSGSGVAGAGARTGATGAAAPPRGAPSPDASSSSPAFAVPPQLSMPERTERLELAPRPTRVFYRPGNAPAEQAQQQRQQASLSASMSPDSTVQTVIDEAASSSPGRREVEAGARSEERRGTSALSWSADDRLLLSCSARDVHMWCPHGARIALLNPDSKYASGKTLTKAEGAASDISSDAADRGNVEMMDGGSAAAAATAYFAIPACGEQCARTFPVFSRGGVHYEYDSYIGTLCTVAWTSAQTFVSASERHCQLWNVVSGEVIWTIDLEVQDLAVWSCHTVSFPYCPPFSLTGADKAAKLSSFSANTWAYILRPEQDIKVVDLATGAILLTIPEEEPVTSIAASKRTTEFLASRAAMGGATTGPSGMIKLYRVTPMPRKKNQQNNPANTDLKVTEVQQYIGHTQARFVVGVTFGGPEEEFVVSGSETSAVFIWHRALGTLLCSLDAHASTVNCVSWPMRSPYLVSGSDDRTVRVWTHAGPQLTDYDRLVLQTERGSGGRDTVAMDAEDDQSCFEMEVDSGL
eukprot:g18929.t1